jgi:succinyl-CoA synthetase alpha subunit
MTHKLFRNLYRDSVSLMQLSATLGALAGIRRASAVMASEANLALLREAGLAVGDIQAGPNDLVVAIEGEDDALADAMATAEAALTDGRARPEGESGRRRLAPRSIEMALGEVPTTNLALISTPGEYAAAEAWKALRLGLHVMLFSDNVAIEDEIALKRYAREHELIVMGPDCGTAIVGGVPLGFANVVRRGEIGAIAASGTGLQQVTCLIDRLGKGISHAIGTGGHDLSARVGGITMLQGLEALAADPATKVIVLISKPPDPEVAAQVLRAAGKAGKPVVVNFLGADPATILGANLHAARTLEDAARIAVALAGGRRPDEPTADDRPMAAAAAETLRFAPGQHYVRGLYSGGTFCYEALLLLEETLGPVHSNTPLDPRYRLPDVRRSVGHTAIDLGDDAFTRGRPHPMIDQGLRNERILKEAADPEVAVVLLDVVLGYGAHADPAAEMRPAIEAARRRAAVNGRHLVVVGSVCGTAADPQCLARQEAALREAGVLLAESNAQAVRLAARIASRPGAGR